MLGENVAQHQAHPAALDDGRRRSRVEIEDKRPWLGQLRGERQRGVEFQRRDLGEPHQRRQVLAQAVIHVAVVPAAPHGRRLHPRRAVLRTVLLVEELGVDSVGIALEREWVVAGVGEDRRSDARVVIDHLPLGETSFGIQDLLEVGQLERAPLDLDFGLGALAHRAPPNSARRRSTLDGCVEPHSLSGKGIRAGRPKAMIQSKNATPGSELPSRVTAIRSVWYSFLRATARMTALGDSIAAMKITDSVSNSHGFLSLTSWGPRSAMDPIAMSRIAAINRNLRRRMIAR